MEKRRDTENATNMGNPCGPSTVIGYTENVVSIGALFIKGFNWRY